MWYSDAEWNDLESSIREGENPVHERKWADELLRSTDLNIDEIADECGFNYTSYFHRCYLEHFGITPKKRREEPEGSPAKATP